MSSSGLKERSWHADGPRSRGIIVMVMFAASIAFPSEFAYLLNTKVLTSSTSSPNCTGTEVAVKPGSHTHSLRCGFGDNMLSGSTSEIPGQIAGPVLRSSCGRAWRFLDARY
jgi:hypothetical protein